ncbi:MAG: hypothetical protein CVU65_07875 [Deltaproteobacteria bacterium HGW-Deltaproteobacteria-22]|nr:MAG: hypothetical protein CVU65_07875 [Deltaproteobacteria bacterium HGW-Deltaproteobacteria-22]
MSRILSLSHLVSCGLSLFILAGCTLDAADLQQVRDGYYCGDGRADDDIGEDCEGDNLLFNATCQTMGYTGGTLTCGHDCKFDYSGCYGMAVCGNNLAEAWETCDGIDLQGADCTDFGYVGGTLTCDEQCGHFDESNCEDPPLCGNGIFNTGEDCDGDFPGVETCESLGLGTGQLACDETCAYDTSGCHE